MEEEGDEDTAGTDGDDESEEEKAAATPGLVLIKEPPKRDPRYRPRESTQMRL